MVYSIFSIELFYSTNVYVLFVNIYFIVSMKAVFFFKYMPTFNVMLLCNHVVWKNYQCSLCSSSLGLYRIKRMYEYFELINEKT